MPRPLLLTGCTGRIGRRLAPALAARYDLLGFDRRPGDGSLPMITGELTDRAALAAALAGREVVVHLAGEPSPHAGYDRVAGPNLEGIWLFYQVAAEAGVKRVVFASSCHTILGHPLAATVGVEAEFRVTGVYGASKVFGEVVGRYFHEHHGIEVLNLRIGYYDPRPNLRSRDHPLLRALFLGPRDLVDLFLLAVSAPLPGCATVYGASVEGGYLDLGPTRRLLGFAPRDRWDEISDDPQAYERPYLGATAGQG